FRHLGSTPLGQWSSRGFSKEKIDFQPPKPKIFSARARARAEKILTFSIFPRENRFFWGRRAAEGGRSRSKRGFGGPRKFGVKFWPDPPRSASFSGNPFRH